MNEIVDGMPQEERQQRRISYYQWVCFLKVLEFLVFLGVLLIF
jgi:hypothetical protein